MLRAALILVDVGSLVAMEFGTPPRVAKAVNQPLPQSAVGAGDSRDTLATADRLEIPYFQNELPIPPISFVEQMPPADSTPVISEDARLLGRVFNTGRWEGADVLSSCSGDLGTYQGGLDVRHAETIAPAASSAWTSDSCRTRQT
jgi:hypothetical protein